MKSNIWHLPCFGLCRGLLLGWNGLRFRMPGPGAAQWGVFPSSLPVFPFMCPCEVCFSTFCTVHDPRSFCPASPPPSICGWRPLDCSVAAPQCPPHHPLSAPAPPSLANSFHVFKFKFSGSCVNQVNFLSIFEVRGCWPVCELFFLWLSAQP